MHKPIIAITMGDPCGVGPEIIAAALVRHALHEVCRPLVLGDPGAIARGIAVCGGSLRLVPVTGPADMAEADNI